MVSLMARRMSRVEKYKEEIHLYATDWWEAVNPQCRQFFQLSAAFNRATSPAQMRRILAQMQTCHAVIRDVPCPNQIASLRDDLDSAMSNLLESYNATLDDDAANATHRLHDALLDLQHFHIVLDRLGLRYDDMS